MKKLFAFALCLGFSSFAEAQCPAGELEVTLVVSTDQWGYENYWEIVPLGNNCGAATIASGGNTNVGCNGGGQGNAAPGSGYGNFQQINEGPFCLTDGEVYTIISVDDYADGGTDFEIRVAGYPVLNFVSDGAVSSADFMVALPPAVEVEVTSIDLDAFILAGEKVIAGAMTNKGTDVVSSFDVGYRIDGGDWEMSTLTNLSISPFQTLTIAHPTLWSALTPGTYVLEFAITNINGNGGDANPANNKQIKTITIKTEIPNIIPSYLDPSITVDIEVKATSTDKLNKPNDLDFHPNGDLWVVNMDTEGSGGSTVKVSNPISGNLSTLWQRDGNAWHFMALPTALAFSSNGNFATSTGIYDANHGQGNPFTGPSLWSSDPSVYAQPSGGNGSHLDMLHESPYCMGISWYHGNAFWVFDKNSNDIVMYDFKEDHGPGNDYHADGEVVRYPELQVDWINANIPSHLKYDLKSDQLFIVDGGNKRILMMDTKSGTLGGTPSFNQTEPLALYTNASGVDYSELVNTGLDQPTGIDVIENFIVVSDYASGDINIFLRTGTSATKVGTVVTGSPGVTGVVIGPEGRIWYVNKLTNQLARLEPSEIVSGLGNTLSKNMSFVTFPNPSNGLVNLQMNASGEGVKDIQVLNTLGQVVFVDQTASNKVQLDLSHLAKGMYMVEVKAGPYSGVQRITLD